MKKLFFSLLFLPTLLFTQKQPPKLVVGIVVDQMRYDYINRFWNKFSDDGFKKLVNNGAYCTNANFNYMPTYTAPGHASIYTGTTPEHHGIISNEWFDKTINKDIYCTDDKTVTTVGSNSKAGKMSPKKLLCSTVTDEIKIQSNFKSKIISISLKDRGAILPGGHKADAAYWFRGKDEGKWISSSYYMNELPSWVENFNTKHTVNNYLNKPWSTLLPITEYTESIKDNNPYEGTFDGEKKPIFPHNLPELRKSNNNYSLIKATPFGNTLTKDFALAALKNENLGKENNTDFLAISFSSTDYIGHMYGPMSVEIEDAYLRLDKDIAELLNYLESNFTSDEVLLFITADHGAVNVPQFLIDNKFQAGYFNVEEVTNSLNEFILKTYQTDSLISNISNYQIFLNLNYINKNKLDLTSIENNIADFLLTQKGIAKTVTSSTLNSTKFNNNVLALAQKGYNQKRSGNVLVILESGWIPNHYSTGTTHGSPYHYDTHVPLIFYGYRIKKGVYNKTVYIEDIAPTISTILNISSPSGTTGKTIYQIIN